MGMAPWSRSKERITLRNTEAMSDDLIDLIDLIDLGDVTAQTRGPLDDGDPDQDIPGFMFPGIDNE